MIGAFQSEPCYANLLTLLAAAKTLSSGVPTSQALFVTASRLAKPISDVSAGQQPALYVMEGEIDFGGNEVGISTDEYKAALLIYFRNAGSSTPASIQMNAIRDAVIYQLRQMTLDAAGNIVPLILGERQTLGGYCYDAFLKGRALANEGLQNGQGAVIFPLTILTGV